jgi:RNA polymerase sigma-B factor
VTALELEADRDAPRAARAWLRAQLELDPVRGAEAALLVSELVGRAVLAGEAPDIRLELEDVATAHRVWVRPGAAPDGLTTDFLDRFATHWGHDAGAVWFDVRMPGSASAALADQSTESLLAAVGTDPEARDEVVRRLTPMAIDISRHYRHKGIADADLEQAAALAVLRALDRYDPDAGRFERFAAATVSGEMKRLLRDRAWSVRVPRGLQERALEVGRAREVLAQRLGRAPSPAEVAMEIGMDVDEVVAAIGATTAYTAASIDAPRPGSPSSAGIGETLADEHDDLALVEQLGDLGPAVAELPDRERTILRLRFVDELTQSEIAERVGISQMHVSRLLRRTLAHLRDAIG